MITNRQAQNRRLHVLLNELKLIDMKAELVHEASEGRTTSSKELYEHELVGLINHLASKLPKPSRQADDAMRKKVFHLCRDMGYITGHNDDDLKMNKAVVYALVLRVGYLKKPLMQYSSEELPKLVSQFVSMQKNNNKAAAAKAVAALKAELGL